MVPLASLETAFMTFIATAILLKYVRKQHAIENDRKIFSILQMEWLPRVWIANFDTEC